MRTEYVSQPNKRLNGISKEKKKDVICVFNIVNINSNAKKKPIERRFRLTVAHLVSRKKKLK